MKSITFDKLFKVVLLALITLYIIVQNRIANGMENSNGRYVYVDKTRDILDTKTGKAILYVDP